MPPTEVYTDGSCIHQREEAIGAWVALIFLEGKKIILKDIVRNSNHNRMELTAVIKAIDYLNSKNITHVNIYSDSQYVVNLKIRREKLKGQNYFSKKGVPIQNADLIKTLVDLMDVNQIELIKVDAHQKKKDLADYNREADQIARRLVRKTIGNLP